MAVNQILSNAAQRYPAMPRNGNGNPQVTSDGVRMRTYAGSGSQS